MPASAWLLLVGVYVLAWAWAGNRQDRRDREMEERLGGLEDEETPEVREAAPTGRKFERRFNEGAATWEPLEEQLALRVLACSFFDVPRVIERMQRGEPVRTPFAEYRLVV